MLGHCTSSSGLYFKDLLHFCHVWQRAWEDLQSPNHYLRVWLWDLEKHSTTHLNCSRVEFCSVGTSFLHPAAMELWNGVDYSNLPISETDQLLWFGADILFIYLFLLGGGVGGKRSLCIYQGLFGPCHTLQSSPEVFCLPVRLLSKFNSVQSKCRVTNWWWGEGDQFWFLIPDIALH